MTQLGLDPECKWAQEALAQKLGVIQQTINTWICDIRARQRAGREIIIIGLNRFACPPCFWRGWTQEKIAKVVGLDRSAVSRIVQNTKISEMHNLLSQGRDMDYIDLLKASGWQLTHIVDCPLPTQRFLPNMVSRMHKNRTPGVVRRSLIVGIKN